MNEKTSKLWHLSSMSQLFQILCILFRCISLWPLDHCFSPQGTFAYTFLLLLISQLNMQNYAARFLQFSFSALLHYLQIWHAFKSLCWKELYWSYVSSVLHRTSLFLWIFSPWCTGCFVVIALSFTIFKYFCGVCSSWLSVPIQWWEVD